MITLKNIHSLSDFIRNAKSRIARLKKTGEPAILTINGQAEAVVLSAASYQSLINELETFKTLNAVHQSTLELLRTRQVPADTLISELQASPDGRLFTAKEAFAEIERRIQQRRKKKAS